MLLSFQEFINEKLLLEEEEKKKDTTPKRMITVVSKDFFSELKEHVFYWFNYESDIKDKYVLTSLEATNDDVIVWFNDVDEILQYKVVYNYNKEVIPSDEVVVDNIKDIKMIVSIYDFNTNDILKTMEMIVDIKLLNSKSFDNLCRKVKNRIILKPENQDDIDNFKKKETRILKDNIY